jgi:hypothetical protein
MARLTDAAELTSAWRALADSAEQVAGWNTIPVATDLRVSVRAGRHFPGNEEALLVGFKAVDLSVSTKLPGGRGFHVSFIDLVEGGNDLTWISLSRLTEGTFDLFCAMSVDILNSLASLGLTAEDQLIDSFLGRIAAWQYFMERGGITVLDAESEIGLFGELVLLNAMLDQGVDQIAGVDSWRGPLGSIRDFEFADISIEVKATTSSSGFPAVISSFEQLDDAIGRRIYLAAIRLGSTASGVTLPELILRTSTRLAGPTRGRFESLILRAGYLQSLAERYDRRMQVSECVLLAVRQEFPRLIRSQLPPAILRGRYVVDLDMVAADRMSIEAVLARREVSRGAG